ncbi:MAG: nucleoside monophosphate kinase [Pseudonocardiaceae bacterium]
MGPPGVGKTTALTELRRRHPAVERFAVRDYGLYLAETGTELGSRLCGPLLRCEMLHDDLVREEFAHFLEHLPPDARCVVVEGYPRSMTQCADLLQVASAHGRLSAFVLMHAADGELRSRIAGRLLCPSCSPQRDHGHDLQCAKCGGALVRRADDAPDRVRQRLRDYHSFREPVAQFFAARRLLHVVDGGDDVDTVRRHLERILVGLDHLAAPQSETRAS